MISLFLGLTAALAWGVHDIFVRFVSQRTSIFAALLTVLTVGLLLQGGAMLVAGQTNLPDISTIGLAVASGIFFTTAGISLYHALGIGPIRLVAPIVASYPIGSIGWAAIAGQPVSALQWLAVLAIVCGVASVAYLSEPSEAGDQPTQRMPAILWALSASASFAITFALGQAASVGSDELTVTFLTRLAAVVSLIFVIWMIKAPYRPNMRQLPLLVGMGILDAIALASIFAAGNQPRPEFAAVASSMFGMITIILAWVFLKESMSRLQWIAVSIAFAGIGFLAI